MKDDRRMSIAQSLSQDFINKESFRRIVSNTLEAMRNRTYKSVEMNLEDIMDLAQARAIRLLNETIASSLQFHLFASLRPNAKEFHSNAASALAYFDEIDRLLQFGFPFPSISPRVRKQLEEVVEIGERNQEIEDYRGRKQWEARFYPEVLGLFWALFEEEPKATSNPGNGSAESAALVFIRSIIHEVMSSEECEKLREALAESGLEFEEWRHASDPALRNKVGTWKKVPKFAGDSDKEWRKCGLAFRNEIQRPVIKQE